MLRVISRGSTIAVWTPACYVRQLPAQLITDVMTLVSFACASTPVYVLRSQDLPFLTCLVSKSLVCSSSCLRSASSRFTEASNFSASSRNSRLSAHNTQPGHVPSTAVLSLSKRHERHVEPLSKTIYTSVIGTHSDINTFARRNTEGAILPDASLDYV